MKKKNYYLIGSLFLLILVVAGYIGIQESQSNKRDKHEDVLDIVLNDQFSMAEDSLIELIESEENADVLKDGMHLNKGDVSAVDEYMDNKYGQYFTEESMTEFIANYVIPYKVFSYFNNVPLSVENISIEEEEGSEAGYYFSVDVLVNQTDQRTVSGRASVNEANKISYFEILNDSGLYDDIVVGKESKS